MKWLILILTVFWSTGFEGSRVHSKCTKSVYTGTYNGEVKVALGGDGAQGDSISLPVSLSFKEVRITNEQFQYRTIELSDITILFMKIDDMSTVNMRDRFLNRLIDWRQSVVYELDSNLVNTKGTAKLKEHEWHITRERATVAGYDCVRWLNEDGRRSVWISRKVPSNFHPSVRGGAVQYEIKGWRYTLESYEQIQFDFSQFDKLLLRNFQEDAMEMTEY